MQSKTSCFNKTIFRKTLTRFWPVWAAYFAVWLLILPLGLFSEREHLVREPIYAQVTVLNLTGAPGAIMAFVFAALMAMAVWSFLYSPRSASGAACLPVTRTAQFISAALGGYLPMAAVHVVVFALTALAEGSLGVLHLPSLLTWLAVTLLELLFFFGFASLCAMLTGHIIVLPAVYAVLNFTAAGFVLLINGVANWFLYGLDEIAGFNVLQYLSPAIPLATTLQARLVYESDAVTGAQRLVSVGFDGWLLAIIYGAVGVLLLLAACALLRRRKMETAGDVVAVQPLRPVFRWCMGIGAGLCFACMMLYVFSLHGFTQRAVFASTAVWLVIGAVLGWLVAEMLIRRSFRVFRGSGRSWIGCALCCAVLLAGLAATELDVLGFERRRPRTEDIEGVMIIADGQGAYLETPEGVAAALELHRGIIDGKPAHDQCGQYAYFLSDDDVYRETVSVSVDYILKNGTHIFRRYTLPHTPGAQDDVAAVQALLNCPEAVQRRKETPFPFTRENVRFGTVSVVMNAVECAAAAGYDDPADYVLQELGGFTPAEAASLQGEARTAAARSALAWQLAYPSAYGFGEDWHRQSAYYEKYAPVGDSLTPEDVPETPEGGLDWDRIWLDYTLELGSDEAWEFYSECLRPDIESGALGRVWIILNEDYGGAVCAGRISVAAAWPEGPAAVDGVPSTRGEYASFITTPTVDARRTAAWLEAHGVHLHTPAEIWGWITY